MGIKKTIITLGLGALIAQGLTTASAQAPKGKGKPAIDFADMDLKVRPQTDFYHYVNGGWIKKNPLKPAYSRFGTFDILRDTATSQIRRPCRARCLKNRLLPRRWPLSSGGFWKCRKLRRWSRY